MIPYQLDFFEEPITEIDLIHHELKDIRNVQDRLRKRHFASSNDIGKAILELHAEVNRLKLLILNKGEK